MSAFANLWNFIWSWYNLPFTLSIIVCLFLSTLQFAGLLGDLLDFDADGEADFELDGDFDTEAGSLTAIFDFLGFRQIPLTILLLVFSAIFGISGWILNYLWLNFVGLEQPNSFIAVYVIALLITMILGSQLSMALAKAIPSTTTTAISKEGLVGRIAEVISPQISENYGQVRVRDLSGTSMTLFAITGKDAKAIPRHTEVVLIEFDPKKKLYMVTPLEDEL